MLFFQKFNKFNGNFSSSSLHHHCRIFLENLPGVSSEVPPRAPSEISSGFYWEFFRDLKWDLLRCSIGIPPEVPKKFLKNPREVLWRIPVKVSLDFFFRMVLRTFIRKFIQKFLRILSHDFLRRIQFHKDLIQVFFLLFSINHSGVPEGNSSGTIWETISKVFLRTSAWFL